MFIAWAQDVSGLPFLNRSTVLPAEKFSRLPPPIGEREKGGWRISIPEKLRTGGMEAHGVLLEDGRPAGVRSRSVREFATNGGAYYHFSHATVRVRPADGSDPRRNGRRYELVGPRPVAEWIPWAGAGLLLAGFLLRQFGDSPSGEKRLARPGGWRDLGVAVALAVGVFLFQAREVQRSDDFHDAVMSVRGMPYSDAIGWNEIGISAAEGRGLRGTFDGQRPFYSVLIGSLHAITGPSLRNGLWVNALAFALSAALVYLLGSCLVSWRTGLAAAAILVIAGEHAHLARVILTETSGCFLAVVSIVLAVLWHRSASGEKPGRWQGRALLAGSGVFFALSNLTCPFTLMAAPLYCALLYARAWRRSAARGWSRFWRALGLPAIFAAGFFVVVAPWLIRQQLVHGQFSLSMQTGELLYTAALPEGATVARANRRTDTGAMTAIAERNRHFMKLFAAEVKADPAAWAGKMLTNAVAFFDFKELLDSEAEVLLVAVLLLLLLARWRSPARLAWLGAFVVSAAVLLAVVRLPAGSGLPAPLLWVFLVSTAAVFLSGSRASRVPVLWLACTIAGAALINALTGNLIPRRAWIFTDWIFWLLFFASGEALMTAVAAGLARLGKSTIAVAGESRPRVWADTRRFTLAVVAVVLVFSTAGGAVLAFRSHHPEDPSAGVQLVEEWAATRQPDPHARIVRALRLGDYRCFLPANVEGSSFSRSFARQPTARTMVMARLYPDHNGTRPLLMLDLPDDVREFPADQACFAVGTLDHDPTAWLGHDVDILRVRSLIPATAAWEPDFARAVNWEPAAKSANRRSSGSPAESR